MYSISEVTDDDIGILYNYIDDEYTKLTKNKMSKHAVIRTKLALRHSDVKFKLCYDDAIIGFFGFDVHSKDTITVGSYYMNPYRRTPKANYLLVKKFTEETLPYSKALYIPIHEDMVLDNKICKEGRIDLLQLRDRLKV